MTVTSHTPTGAGGRHVENPPHVHEHRMRHLTDADLLAGFRLDPPSPAMSSAGPPADPQVGRAPDASGLRAAMARPGRPRPARDIARWARAAGRPEAAAAREAADALLSAAPVDFTDRSVGKSKLYALHYLTWLTPLVQAHALTGDRRYAAAFAEVSDRWYESRDQAHGDWPGLDVIWYSLGVAGRGDLLLRAMLEFAAVDAVSDRTFLRIAATVVGGARWLAEEHAAFRHGNWQFHAAGALLQAAALLPEHAEAGEWSAVARARIEDHLAIDVYPDGGHYERAPSYHLMCVQAMQDAAVTAEQVLDWPLADHPAFARMYDWLIAMTTPDGWVPPFNDSQVVWTGNHLVTGHYLLSRPDYKALVERWVSRDQVRSILSWLPPRPGHDDPYVEYERAPAAATTPARSQWLTGSRYAVHRTGWTTEDLHLAVNCGPMVEHELESHSHHSALDIVLAGHGTPLIWEAGGPASYDDPAYYGWYQATAAHSTVLVPGRTLDPEHEARLETFLALSEIDIVSASQHGWGTPHRRTVLLVHAPGAEPYLVVTDELAGVDEFTQVLHAPTAWLDCGSDRHRAAGGPGVLVAGADPARLVATQLTEGVASYPDRSGNGRRYDPLYGLHRRLAGERAVTVLAPYRDQPPQLRVEQAPAAGRPRGGAHTRGVPGPDVGDAADLVVTIGGHQDFYGDHWWIRSRAGEPVAAAWWPGGQQPDSFATGSAGEVPAGAAETPAVGAGAGSGRGAAAGPAGPQPAGDAAGRQLVHGAGIAAVSAHWQPDSVVATVDATGRATVNLWLPGATAVRVAEVLTPARIHGDEVSVRLPSAGRWTVRVERAMQRP